MKATVKTNTASSNPEIFEFDIPEMTGSEKQVEWANKIYIDIIAGLCNMVTGKMHNDNVKRQYDMIVAKLQTVKDAKFWIDNRNNNFQVIYKSL